MDTLAATIIERAQRTPAFHLDQYMERYWVTDDPKGAPIDLMAQRVHHILRADRDAHYHDHPWENFTLVLDGWLTERVPQDQLQDPKLDATHYIYTTHRAGAVIHRQAHTRHRITEVSHGGVWTLFTMGHWEKDWGFYTPDGFVYWREYLNEWGDDPPAGAIVKKVRP